jgi:hypothetical protein
MKSMDLIVGGALYLYTIYPMLTDSSDFFPYKGSLFLWFCIEPPRHAWRRPAIQHRGQGSSSVRDHNAVIKLYQENVIEVA